MDQIIFENLDSLLQRLFGNVEQWFSDHGLEILIILFVAWIVRRFGGQFFARILEKTARADLYPSKSDRVKRLNTLESMANDLLKVGTYIIAAIMIIGELGVDTSELVLVAVLALIFIGPKDLPRVARSVGRWVAKGRAMAREFQDAIEDMAREADPAGDPRPFLIPSLMFANDNVNRAAEALDRMHRMAGAPPGLEQQAVGAGGKAVAVGEDDDGQSGAVPRRGHLHLVEHRRHAGEPRVGEEHLLVRRALHLEAPRGEAERVQASWQAEGPALCAVAKRTGTNANMGGTAIDFQSLGGTWEVTARPGGGTIVRAVLPVIQEKELAHA